MNVCVVHNHWGWSPRGIVTWIRFGWSFFSTWGVEISGSNPRLYQRRCKIGMVAFDLGEYRR